jgi:hypothetical protein
MEHVTRMVRFSAIIGIGLMVMPALAQSPGYGSPYAAPGPSIVNRPMNTLSPYLNMLRIGPPGVNYYNGVRGAFIQSGLVQYANRANTPTPLPQSGPASAGQLAPSEGYVLPPAGHTNTYGNFFGTAGSSLPGYSANRGPIAPGIANTRPAPKPARR